MGGRAGAQDSSEGARLFEEGRAFAEQGKYEEACERYAKSYELERAAGTMLNLGDCAEREGKLGRAWQLFDAAARDLERGGKARANRARWSIHARNARSGSLVSSSTDAVSAICCTPWR